MLLPVMYNVNTRVFQDRKMPVNRACDGISSSFNGNVGVYNNLKVDAFVPSFKASILSGMKLFKKEAMDEQNPKWANAVSRRLPLDDKPDDVRTPFERDRNRIMHSEAFDRLRFKTQVYPLPDNDMLCTRSSHVLQVADVARNISKRLGLNEELAEAIAQGHDIGHAPFGHEGEYALRDITKKHGLPVFWHEKNSLRMVDRLITLQNSKGLNRNLDLTYAVRDGIVNHCGEVDENFIKPRKEFIDLDDIKKPAQVQPYTWEAIVVKIADKIAYLGRDIDDALRAGVWSEKELKELKKIVKKIKPDFNGEINNSAIMNLFINDIVRNSSPSKGIGFSEPVAAVMTAIKKYNTENIYFRENVKKVSPEATIKIIDSIYNHYDLLYKGKDTIDYLQNFSNPYVKSFRAWLVRYTDNPYKKPSDVNEVVYDLNNYKDYQQAIVDYISGMTDKFAIKTYNSFSVL